MRLRNFANFVRIAKNVKFVNLATLERKIVALRKIVKFGTAAKNRKIRYRVQSWTEVLWSTQPELNPIQPCVFSVLEPMEEGTHFVPLPPLTPRVEYLWQGVFEGTNRKFEMFPLGYATRFDGVI